MGVARSESRFETEQQPQSPQYDTSYNNSDGDMRWKEALLPRPAFRFGKN